MYIRATQHRLELAAGEHLSLAPEQHQQQLLFIDSGNIAVWHDDIAARSLSAGEDLRMFSLSDFTDTVEIRSETDSTLYLTEPKAFDAMAAWLNLAGALDMSFQSCHALLLALHAESLRDIPIKTVCELTRRMQERKVVAGEVIVQQGDIADTFYILLTGAAEIIQHEPGSEQGKVLATLGSGDIFGDYAVVTGGNRTATIRMVQDGTLLEGSKDDFFELITRPNVTEVHPAVAQAMISTGHKVLDVRYAEEHEDEHIPDSIHVPLHELKKRHTELDPQSHYVVYCRSGKRSLLAALILKQQGFQVSSLKGGIIDWPYEIRSAY